MPVPDYNQQILKGWGQVLGSQSLVIGSGQSVTPAMTVPVGQTVTGLFVPTGWTAAVITAQASNDGGTTWFDVYDRDGEYSLPAAAGRALIIPAADLVGFSLIRFRSGTSAAAVAQAGAASTRTLTAITKLI
jgi:hypothetical protein